MYKRQYKFWLKVLEDVEKDPSIEISCIINSAIYKNISYIKHYKNLVSSYRNTDECYMKLKGDFNSKMKEEIATYSVPIAR